MVTGAGITATTETVDDDRNSGIPQETKFLFFFNRSVCPCLPSRRWRDDRAFLCLYRGIIFHNLHNVLSPAIPPAQEEAFPFRS